MKKSVVGLHSDGYDYELVSFSHGIMTGGIAVDSMMPVLCCHSRSQRNENVSFGAFNLSLTCQQINFMWIFIFCLHV